MIKCYNSFGDNMEIMEKIKEIRKQKKISREEMAKKLYISQSTYREMEYGHIRLSLDNYLLICKVLEISPMELIKKNTAEHIVLIDERDLKELNRIIEKINNQIIDNSKYEYLNQSNNIQIGDHNSINNSFNKK